MIEKDRKINALEERLLRLESLVMGVENEQMP